MVDPKTNFISVFFYLNHLNIPKNSCWKKLSFDKLLSFNCKKISRSTFTNTNSKTKIFSGRHYGDGVYTTLIRSKIKHGTCTPKVMWLHRRKTIYFRHLQVITLIDTLSLTNLGLFVKFISHTWEDIISCSILKDCSVYFNYHLLNQKNMSNNMHNTSPRAWKFNSILHSVSLLDNYWLEKQNFPIQSKGTL